MLKSLAVLTIASTIALSAQADQRTGGDDAYIIDNRTPITSKTTFIWPEARARGGDMYMGPVQSSKAYKITIEHRKSVGGDNH